MCTCEGLSLTEVLVSLLLVTSASLALIQQQWHVSQFTHQIKHRDEAMLQLDNASEQLLAQHDPSVDGSFQLTHRLIKNHMVLELSWEASSLESSGGHLKRLLVNA